MRAGRRTNSRPAWVWTARPCASTPPRRSRPASRRAAAGTARGAPPLGEQDWRRLATEWFPQLTDHRLRQVSWPGIEPHRDYIAAQLKAGVTVATIHQRLRDEHGLEASVASVRRWVRATLPEQARRAQVTVLGDAPPPGEQAQIDYGRLR